MFKKLIRYLRNADAKEAEAQRKTHEEYIGWEQQRKKKRLEKTIEDKRSWQERLLTDEQKHFRDLFVSKLDHEPLETGHKIMTDIDDVYVYEMLELIDAIETKEADKKKRIEEAATKAKRIAFIENTRRLKGEQQAAIDHQQDLWLQQLRGRQGQQQLHGRQGRQQLQGNQIGYLMDAPQACLGLSKVKLYDVAVINQREYFGSGSIQ